jgi:hypothetical protein
MVCPSCRATVLCIFTVVRRRALLFPFAALVPAVIRILQEPSNEATIWSVIRGTSLESLYSPKTRISLFALDFRSPTWRVLGNLAHSVVARDGKRRSQQNSNFLERFHQSGCMVGHLVISLWSQFAEFARGNSSACDVCRSFESGVCRGSASYSLYDIHIGNHIRLRGGHPRGKSPFRRT